MPIFSRDSNSPLRTFCLAKGPWEFALFKSVEQAVGHLRDHLLTAPECEAWTMIAYDYPELTELLEDSDQRYELAKKMEKAPETALPELYVPFSNQLEREILDALRNAWGKDELNSATQRMVTVMFSSSGVFMIVEADAESRKDGCLVTTYVPGFGDAESVSRAGEKSGPLPREGVRRRKQAAMKTSKREEREREKREAKYSDEERVFFKVFRPARQFLSGRHYKCYSIANKRVETNDIALLKDIVENSLELEDWQQRRAGR